MTVGTHGSSQRRAFYPKREKDSLQDANNWQFTAQMQYKTGIILRD